MIYWKPPTNPNDTLFLAEKNCTTVSHELAHELLRSIGYKKFKDVVHEIWSKHFYDQLYFEQYDSNFKKTDGKPTFLTIDTSGLKI